MTDHSPRKESAVDPPATLAPAAPGARQATGSPPVLIRQVSPAVALRSVTAGATVMTSPYCGTPTTLLAALAKRSYEVPDLSLLTGLIFGESSFLEAVRAGHLRFRTWHLASEARALAWAGAVEYVPARAHDIERLFLSGGPDVALARVTPPDDHGNCSLGPSASYSKAMLTNARIRIAEVDPELPRTRGADVTYPFDAFEHVVEAQAPASTYPAAPPSTITAEIAANVLPLLADGDTVQLGIGRVPEAIAHALSDSATNDLRLVGMFTDAMVALADQHKIIDEPGAVQAVELLGTSRVFDYAHGNPAVEMRSSATVHDPMWLAMQPRMVSICSAIAVDLTGQVASEQVGNRLLAGIGGAADFFEGAGHSSGGLRIVALSAATGSGASRFRAHFPPDTPVTIPRHSVDYVITEYGAAHLTGRSLRERVEAITQVVAPQHRDQFQDASTRVLQRKAGN